MGHGDAHDELLQHQASKRGKGHCTKKYLRLAMALSELTLPSEEEGTSAKDGTGQEVQMCQVEGTFEFWRLKFSALEAI